jgi:hypothetical protein
MNVPTVSPSTPVRNNEQISHESCSSCLWTGVTTCLGLSAYFAHIAFDAVTPSPSPSPPPTINPLDGMSHNSTTNAAVMNAPKPILNPPPLSLPVHSRNTVFVRMIQPWLASQPFHQLPPPIAPYRVSRYHKPVFLLISAGWLMVGAYRWHLG